MVQTSSSLFTESLLKPEPVIRPAVPELYLPKHSPWPGPTFAFVQLYSQMNGVRVQVAPLTCNRICISDSWLLKSILTFVGIVRH